MLNDDILIELGFEEKNIDELTYFVKDHIKIEKIFRGYLCFNPYKLVSTTKELNEIIIIRNN